MDLDTIARNRLFLFASFVVIFLATRADLPEGYPMHLTLLEAVGGTFAAAIPALIGRLWLKKWYHGYTLGFAIFMAWGLWYTRTHQH